MKKINLVQKSEEWKQWRNTRICASDLPIIMGVSKWSTPYQLWRKKLGFESEQDPNSAMNRGVFFEPVVCDRVNFETGRSYKPLVIQSDEFEWAGASLDGYDEDSDTILEIKCPNKDDHALTELGKVPNHYIHQVQWQLFCSGCETALYVSFHSHRLAQVIVYRDDILIAEMVKKAAEFYECLKNFEPPETLDKEHIFIDDSEFEKVASKYFMVCEKEKILQLEKKALKECLQDFTDDGNIESPTTKMTRVFTETTDWKKFYEELCKHYPDIKERFSLDRYKTKSIGFWKITQKKK